LLCDWYDGLQCVSRDVEQINYRVKAGAHQENSMSFQEISLTLESRNLAIKLKTIDSRVKPHQSV